MAAKLNHSDELVENHEINVTPFIDVMLVLLIIFMVAAPLATVDVKVDLPSASAAPVSRPDKPVYLTIKADGSLALGNDPVTGAALGRRLAQLTHGDRDQRIFVRADKSVDYGIVMEAMNGLRGEGYLKVALVGLDGGLAGK